MEETLRILVALAFALLFVVLRSDAPRFGVADHLEPLAHVPLAVARRRLAWYGLALALTTAIVLAHPRPRDELGLTGGELGPTLAFGLLGTVLGVVAVAGALVVRGWRPAGVLVHATGGLASIRAALLARLASLDGSLRWLGLDVAVTAVADELAFRGALLGFLLVAGFPPIVAVAIQLLVYALVVRTAGPDGDRGQLLLALGIGLLGGLVTLASGGVGAAIVMHLAVRAADLVGRASEAAPRATASAAG